MLHVHFSGRLGKDAAFKLVKTANGEKPMCQFTVASDDGYGERKTTEWVNVAVWGKHSEKLSTFLTKGKQVTITGTLKKRMYESNGKTGCSLEVDASNMGGVEMFGGKDEGRRNEDKRESCSDDGDDPF